MPFDFTGHWDGTVMEKGGTAPVVADFAGTSTFTGSIGILFGSVLTCTASGKQKKRVTVTVTCSDGSAGKLKAKLDATAGTLEGAFHSHRKGHHPSHGTFTLTRLGTCVPTGGDCTDPTTGSGEASVCCDGDCTQVTNGHACN